jgi:hypothetical protein
MAQQVHFQARRPRHLRGRTSSPRQEDREDLPHSTFMDTIKKGKPLLSEDTSEDISEDINRDILDTNKWLPDWTPANSQPADRLLHRQERHRQ